jgi:hypothetical protein
MTDVASETNRRLELWVALSKERLDNIEPARLRDLGVYGGAHGSFKKVPLLQVIQRYAKAFWMKYRFRQIWSK